MIEAAGRRTIRIFADNIKSARVLVQKGDLADTYALTGTERDVFPLKYGQGGYTIKLCRQKTGKIYTVERTEVYTVRGAGDWRTERNQYVWWEWLFAPRSIQDVEKWVASHIAYDYVRAATIPKWGNVLPDIARCMEKHMGICLDIAGLTVAMLRDCGIPAKLVIGKRGTSRHAWAVAYGENGAPVMLDTAAKIQSSPDRIKRGMYRTEREY